MSRAGFRVAARGIGRPLENHSWVHNFDQGNQNPAVHSMNPLSLERQFELMQMRQIHEDGRRRGRRASMNDMELDRALSESANGSVSFLVPAYATCLYRLA